MERGSSSFVTTTTTNLSKIRNIGTIAHIDAGKTTVTERLLHFAGALRSMGEVHDGTALMDFLEQERQRGITIRSACVSFNFRGHQVNLIDTPGHADFNFEVERALKVLDGALVILDGGKGVEAQTETVWLQSNKYKIPKLCIVNKLDKLGADFAKSLAEVSSRFKITTLVPFVPHVENEQFRGVVDLPSNRYFSWKVDDNGEHSFFDQPLTQDLLDSATRRLCEKHLEEMLEHLAPRLPQLTDEYLAGPLEPSFFALLKHGLRETILLRPNEVCLGFPCSALKNKGLQPILNGIIDYLPSPRENKDDQRHLVFVYRSLFDETHGKINVVRVFKGDLERSTSLFNARTGRAVPLSGLFRIHANEFVEIAKAEEGDIVGIKTEEEVLSGDNLVSDLGRAASSFVSSYQISEPLYIASLEFDSREIFEKFSKVIGNYLVEDPSLRYEFDKPNDQHIVKGLGELHIEVLLSRLKSDHGISVGLKRANVALLETVRGQIEVSETFQANIRGQFFYFDVTLLAEPIDFEEFGTPSPAEIELDIFGPDRATKLAYERFRNSELKRRAAPSTSTEDKDASKAKQPARPAEKVITRNLKKPVEVKPNFEFKNGQTGPIYQLNSLDFSDLFQIEQLISNALVRGPLTCSRVAGVKVIVSGGSYSKTYFGDVALKSAVGKAASKLLERHNVELLEPYVAVTIDSHGKFVDEIIQDAMSRKRGKIDNVIAEGERATFNIRLPMENSMKYADYLRSVTSGDAKFSFAPSGYARVPEDAMRAILARRN